MTNRFTDDFEEANQAFNSQYKNALADLKGMSTADLTSIIPKGADSQTYIDLVKTIDDASRNNISQAELKNNITNLGQTALKLALKVPSIASLLV